MDRVPAIAVESGYARSGDRIVITAGIPLGVSGSTNSIKAAIVP
jgi:pyruvate kinase